MTQLLGRKYRLTFGKPGAKGKAVTGLDVNFTVEKTTEFKPNTATITVYNLSKENRAALEESDIQITLEAGYEGQFGIIFLGNDLIVQTRKIGVDYETTIRSRDGGKEISDTPINLEIPGGEFLEDSVREVVKVWDKTLGREVELKKLPKKKAKKSKAISKPVAEVLNLLLEPEGFEWSIQDGEFRVVEKTKGSDETVFVLGPTSGLIGSPERTKFRLPGDKTDTEGISFTCLLNPQVTPLRRVKLEGLSVKGIYKITRVRYVGDLKGNDWYCHAEGIPL